MKTHILLYMRLQCNLLRTYMAKYIASKCSEERHIYMSNKFLRTSHGIGDVKQKRRCMRIFDKN
jgi:hypothetical protein